MNFMRKYIAMCKKQAPTVPEDLSDYIVGKNHSEKFIRKESTNNLSLRSCDTLP